jgi:lipoate-protein ligase A
MKDLVVIRGGLGDMLLPSGRTNIREIFPSPLKMDEFKNLIKEALMLAFGGEQGEHCLTPADLRRIEELKREKYETWEWNFGLSPSHTTSKKADYSPGGSWRYSLMCGMG